MPARTKKPAAPVPVPAAPPSDPAPPADPAPAPLKYLVYTIEDPTTAAVLYVGATGRTVDRRMREHMIEALVDLDGDPQALALRHLVYGPTAAPTVRPRVRAIARFATRAEAEAAEKSYIKAFRAAGHPLTNAPLRDEALPAAAPVATPSPAPVRILGSAPAPAALTRQWRADVGAEFAVSAARPAARPAATPPRFAWRWPPLTGWVSALLGVSVVVLVWVGTTLVPPAAASTNAPVAAAPAPMVSPVAAPTVAARRPTGQASVQVGASQSFADVAARLGWTPAELATALGRAYVTPGETITRPLYDGATTPALERAPPQARVVGTVVPTAVPVAGQVAEALFCTACGGGPATAPQEAPTYNDPAIQSGGSLDTQEVGAVTPRYNDPAIRSGGSIADGPRVLGAEDGRTSLHVTPVATPGPVWVLGTTGPPAGSARPRYDDPTITSGGSIGGDGP